MTPDELKKLDEAISAYDYPQTSGGVGSYDLAELVRAARTLSQLMHGTHPVLVVVPREPTKEMVSAGRMGMPATRQFDEQDFQTGVYKDMIAAARKDKK